MITDKKYSYDIIGDIHGCSLTLKELLDKLGYAADDQGIYRYGKVNENGRKRTVIFLGDFIDRGPFQREVLSIVEPMIRVGSAMSVMGNHEYNAIAYATSIKEPGKFLREHSEKNKDQHKAFLNEYEFDSPDHKAVITWFKSLPLWIDLGGLRIIHACWDWKIIDKIGKPVLTDNLLRSSCDKEKWQYEAIEIILKGKEIPLPGSHRFYDKDGNPRHDIRVRWWDQTADTYRKAFFGPESARTHIPDDKIAGDHLIEYSHDAPPVFLGHYWMDDEIPEPLAPNIACNDYSVAKPGGKLVAYQWDGEEVLNKDNFVVVNRIEPIS